MIPDQVSDEIPFASSGSCEEGESLFTDERKRVSSLGALTATASRTTERKEEEREGLSEEMSLLLVSKQYVEILGLVMFIITLILARILTLKKLTTNNTGTGTGAQLAEGNIASVTISSNLQLDLKSIITM
uniref:Uncharacterized protein n=1 Tax=Fagus sylvatica TaxID=28930 RepID=A0A2N9G968_FAGSY